MGSSHRIGSGRMASRGMVPMLEQEKNEEEGVAESGLTVPHPPEPLGGRRWKSVNGGEGVFSLHLVLVALVC